jgi:hypothetical protein
MVASRNEKNSWIKMAAATSNSAVAVLARMIAINFRFIGIVR